MSAAGRGGPREPEDYYTTPSWAVRRLLEAWDPKRRDAWVEPSAGNGAIIRAVDAMGKNVGPASWRAYEIREEERDALEGLCGVGARIENFLRVADEPDESIQVVLGNPPYAYAEEFVHQARRLFPYADVVFLLRMAFIASQDRQAFMSAHAPDLFVLPDRPSFTGGGGDSADYAWFHWPHYDRRAGNIQVLALTPLAERQRDRGHDVMIEPAQRALF